MTEVIFAGAESYSREELHHAIFQVFKPQLEAYGSLEGKSVMLKPNLLAWKKAEDPACVHPAFIVETARIFLVKYNQKVIGGAFCLFSGESAYLCFSGGMNKTYPLLSPNAMAVWAAITYAFQRKYMHFEFVDAGLPFQKMGYRNFILSFGGKQVSTRRWFRFRWNWLNSLLIKLYR